MRDYRIALHQRFCKEPKCSDIRRQISEVKRNLRQVRTGEDRNSC